MHEILIADDEPMVIRVLRQALEHAGYDVHAVGDGEQALERIHQQAPDVLITDIEMPRMSGEELCLALQREPASRPFPIFVLTSKTAREHRSLSERVDDLVFLEKPVSARQLLAKLRDHFLSRDLAETRPK